MIKPQPGGPRTVVSLFSHLGVPWVPETFLARFTFSEAVLAFGRKFPSQERKTSGTQGNVGPFRLG